MSKRILGAVFGGLFAFALTGSVYAQAFKDVDPTHWAYDAINEAVKRGLLEGYPDGTFQGKRPITRYEMAMILARIMKMIDQIQPGVTVTPEKKNGEKPPKKPKFASKAEFEDFKSRIEKLATEFQDELQALGVRVGDLEDRVGKLEEQAGKSDVELSGSISLFGWRMANELGDLLKQDAAGSDTGVDQFVTVTLSKKFGEDGKGVITLYGRNWDNQVAGRVGGNNIFLSKGWGQEGFEAQQNFSIGQAYVEASTPLGRVSIGRQAFKVGPVGLLLDAAPPAPYESDYGVLTTGDKVKWIGYAGQVSNIGKDDRILGGRAEIPLGDREDSALGLNLMIRGPGNLENTFGVDGKLTLSNGGSLWGEFVRADHGPTTSNNFVGGATLINNEKLSLTVSFSNIDKDYKNPVSVLQLEGAEGIFRTGFTGFGVSGSLKVGEGWRIYGDANKGDSDSPTGFVRGNLEYTVNESVTAKVTGILIGQESASRIFVAGGGVNVNF